MVRGIVRALALVGGVCILAGAALALYAAWVVLRLIEDPGSVPGLSHFSAIAASNLSALRGTMDGRSFEIGLEPAIYSLGMLLIGVLLLVAVASLAKALISAGLKLVGTALNRTNR